MDWKTCGYQVIAGAKVEEFGEYAGALKYAIEQVRALVAAGISQEDATQSVQLFRVQALDFRQVQGSKGLLFALQSPVCDAAGIFAHVRAFLDEQRSVLEGLDDATLSGALDALQATLRPAKSNLARAEQLWQLYLAGLPELHPLQVQQALQSLSASDLLRAHEQLLLARDWRVLASGAPAATD